MMELHVYHAIREVMTVPHINQFFLSDGLSRIEISEKILVVKTQGDRYFVAFR